MNHENINFEILDIEDLQLLSEDENPRVHSERNLEDIGDSIDEFGLFRSIGIDENNKILVGNGTTTASKLKGKKKVLVIESDGETLVAVRRKNLTDEQKQKVIIADNRTGETSEWNNDVLIQMMDGFQDMNHTGWNTDEFQHLKESHEFDEDDFNHLFHQSGEGERKTGIVIKLSYSEGEGKQILEGLQEINENVSKAVAELLKSK